jgi:transglutaminase-like putative cysteine protease
MGSVRRIAAPMYLKIHHKTVFNYPRPVVNSVNEVWLRPLSDERQHCLSFALTTDPGSQPRPYTDYFGNTVYHFDVAEPHERLQILADAEVETHDGDAAVALASDRTPYAPLPQHEQDRWLDWLSETPLTVPGPAVRRLARDLMGHGGSVAALAQAIAARVQDALGYETGITGVNTTAEDALNLGVGVCQDYSHVFLSLCRLMGMPARYVSGYLSTEADGDQRQHSHAWPEVLLPVAGWIAFDPTNRRLVDGRYVRIAVGRDYSDVPPVRGAYSGPSGNGLDVSVYVMSDQQ